MSKRESAEEAKRILSDVRPENCFWVNNGPILRNLHELVNCLSHMDNVTFLHHVNKEKNDIANWLNDIIKDEWLANRIRKLHSKDKMLKALQARIKELELVLDQSIISTAKNQ